MNTKLQKGFRKIIVDNKEWHYKVGTRGTSIFARTPDKKTTIKKYFGDNDLTVTPRLVADIIKENIK